jgi:hypothetical protein
LTPLRLLSLSLPHEITHTILADHFRAPVPRWADERAATLAEDAEGQQRHQALMRGFLGKRDRLSPLTRLLTTRDYPRDLGALYAQGHSLTRFLVERKDRTTFLAFVKQGMNGHDETRRRRPITASPAWRAWSLARVRGKRRRRATAADRPGTGESPRGQSRARPRPRLDG